MNLQFSSDSMHTKSRGQKRQFVEVHPRPNPKISTLPTKRPKSKEEPQPEPQSASPFRDSKLWLTRSALKELERRTAKPVKPVPIYEFNLTRECSNQIKRFARHGGPDLCDLRVVR